VAGRPGYGPVPMRRRLVVIFSMLGALLGAPAAEAASRAITVLREAEWLADYGASGAWHVALLTSAGTDRIARSSDRGVTFDDVAVPPEMTDVDAASVEADGRTWLSGRGPQGTGRLVRLEPDGSRAVVLDLPGENGVELSAVVSSYGRRWVAITDGRSSSSASATVREVTLDGAGPGSTPIGAVSTRLRLVADARGLWVDGLDRSWRVDAGGGVQPSSRFVPDITPLGTDVRRLDDRLWRVVTPEVWWRAEPEVERFDRVWPVEGGFVLSQAFTSQPPRFVTAVETYGPRGSGSPAAERLVAAANRFRVQQGLPPIILDPVVSRASANHAAYDRRWRESHAETPGREGFTGRTPQERCAFVGTSCGGEIMHYRRSPEEAVADWWATPLHRGIIGDPDTVAAGGGEAVTSAGATQVMNDAGGDALAVAPIGLPRGSWSGQLGFIGEVPDPGRPCGMSAPYGLAQTAYPFTDPATGASWGPRTISLRDLTAGGATVRGCSPAGSGYHVPDDALQPGHRYEVTAEYVGDGAVRRHVWTFETAGARAQADPAPGPAPRGPARRWCVRASRTARNPKRHHAGLRLVSCRATTVQVRVQRRGRTVWRRSVRLTAGRPRVVRVGPLRPGRLQAQISGQGGRAALRLVVRR
jgi:uncharacterized protein YkwD